MMDLFGAFEKAWVELVVPDYNCAIYRHRPDPTAVVPYATFELPKRSTQPGGMPVRQQRTTNSNIRNQKLVLNIFAVTSHEVWVVYWQVMNVLEDLCETTDSYSDYEDVLDMISDEWVVILDDDPKAGTGLWKGTLDLMTTVVWNRRGIEGIEPDEESSVPPLPTDDGPETLYSNSMPMTITGLSGDFSLSSGSTAQIVLANGDEVFFSDDWEAAEWPQDWHMAFKWTPTSWSDGDEAVFEILFADVVYECRITEDSYYVIPVALQASSSSSSESNSVSSASSQTGSSSTDLSSSAQESSGSSSSSSSSMIAGTSNVVPLTVVQGAVYAVGIEFEDGVGSFTVNNSSAAAFTFVGDVENFRWSARGASTNQRIKNIVLTTLV